MFVSFRVVLLSILSIALSISDISASSVSLDRDSERILFCANSIFPRLNIDEYYLAQAGRLGPLDFSYHEETLRSLVGADEVGFCDFRNGRPYQDQLGITTVLAVVYELIEREVLSVDQALLGVSGTHVRDLNSNLAFNTFNLSLASSDSSYKAASIEPDYSNELFYSNLLYQKAIASPAVRLDLFRESFDLGNELSFINWLALKNEAFSESEESRLIEIQSELGSVPDLERSEYQSYLTNLLCYLEWSPDEIVFKKLCEKTNRSHLADSYAEYVDLITGPFGSNEYSAAEPSYGNGPSLTRTAQGLVDALLAEETISYRGSSAVMSLRSRSLILLSELVLLFRGAEDSQGDFLFTDVLENGSGLDQLMLLAIKEGGLAYRYMSKVYRTYRDAGDMKVLDSYDRFLSNEYPHRTCGDFFEQKLNTIENWPENLPKLSKMFLRQLSLGDYDSLDTDESFVALNASIVTLDPSRFIPQADPELAGDCYFELHDGKEYVRPILPKEIGRSNSVNITFPHLWLAGASGNPRYLSSAISSLPKGSVEWVFRVEFPIKLTPDLKNFPFSMTLGQQAVGITDSNPSQRTIVVDAVGSFKHPLPLLEIGANAGSTETSLGKFDFVFAGYNGLVTSKVSNQMIIFDHQATSEYMYYIYKIAAPMIMFGLLCLITLNRPIDRSEAHLQVATTLLVALVAYQFVIEANLPKTAYLTTFDKFIVGLLLSGAFAVAANTVLHQSFEGLGSLKTYVWNAFRACSLGAFLFSTGTILWAIYKL